MSMLVKRLVVAVVLVGIAACGYYVDRADKRAVAQRRSECTARKWTGPIDTVLIHEPWRYSLLVPGDRGSLRRVELRQGRDSIAIFRNSDGVARIDAVGLWNGRDRGCGWGAKIYLGGIRIGGGGWDHGKFGSGQTVPIE